MLIGDGQETREEGDWSSGMIPVQGTGGPGFNSRIAPFYKFTVEVCYFFGKFMGSFNYFSFHQQYLYYYSMAALFAGLAFVVMAMVVKVHCNEDSKTSQDSIQIYGVRCFLGQKYRFQEPITVRYKNQTISDLVLFFNTQQQWQQYTFSVVIGKKGYACSSVEVVINITERHHVQFNQFASKKGQTFTTYIYKCPILFDDQTFLEYTPQISYTIYVDKGKVDQKLFSSVLRSPSYQTNLTSFTVFGDWGVLSNFSKQSLLSQPITDCLLQQIEESPQIRLMLLLGDLAYDLQGKSYINFFSYLQTFSSKLVILYSPGNHETIKHKDIYQLIKQSFYSPYWSAFYGYFDLVSIGKYVFIGYNTQGLFPGLSVESNSSLFQIQLEEEYDNFYNLFAMQLPPSTKTKLKEHKVIAFSHYPMYCSEEDHHESCIDYRERHEPYLQQLQEIGMDLLFSGHLHIYERSKQICGPGGIIHSGKIDEENFQYASKENCTIFIIEGAAGNNYFVETDRHYDLRPHSEIFVDNTGFGVLTLNEKDQITNFKHIIVDNCKVVDELVLHHSPTIKIDGLIVTSEIPLQYIIIIGGTLILFIVIFTKILRRRKAQKHANGHKLSTISNVNVLELAENQSLN